MKQLLLILVLAWAGGVACQTGAHASKRPSDDVELRKFLAQIEAVCLENETRNGREANVDQCRCVARNHVDFARYSEVRKRSHAYLRWIVDVYAQRIVIDEKYQDSNGWADPSGPLYEFAEKCEENSSFSWYQRWKADRVSQ